MMVKMKKLTPAEIQAQVKQAALALIMPDLKRLKGRAIGCIFDACNPNRKRTVTKTVEVIAPDGTETVISKTVTKIFLPPSQSAAKTLIRIVDEIYNRLGVSG